MKKESEALLQNHIIDFMMKIGYEVLRINTMNMKYYKAYSYKNLKVSKGIPDLLCFKKDDYLFIEVKDKNKKPNENQILVHQHFDVKSIPYLVVDDMNILFDKFDKEF
jgi:Holliday junction resolvase